MSSLQPGAKILLLTEPSGGGSGRHCIDLAKELSARGYQVHVVYSKIRAEMLFEDELKSLEHVKISTIPMRRSVGPEDFIAALRLRQLIKAQGPFAVIHAHSSKAGALARIVAPSGIPRIYTPHAFITMSPSIGKRAARLYGSIESFLAKTSTEAIIVVSQEELEHALSLGIPRSRLFLIHNGIFPRSLQTREQARLELKLPLNAIVVGFVGRMSSQKNPVRFAKAIRAAAEIDPRIFGVMIGTGELLNEVSQIGGNKVLILGNRDARTILPAFDILAMTSNYEAMPYVLIEALHAGLPIVATKVGGTTATLHSGQNGICVPVDASPESFATAILKLLNNDLLKPYATASLTLSKSFTAHAMVDQTLAVYRICSRGKA